MLAVRVTISVLISEFRTWLRKRLSLTRWAFVTVNAAVLCAMRAVNSRLSGSFSCSFTLILLSMCDLVPRLQQLSPTLVDVSGDGLNRSYPACLDVRIHMRASRPQIRCGLNAVYEHYHEDHR